jgi:TetR/AcrR family transcriptional regulator, regulator of autoinduction and epiphytic fitness
VNLQELEARGFDPRQIRTRERVFAAARVVLRREGIGGVTIDAIAVEAGIARSTVYRNWASCDELLSEAFDDVAIDASFSDARQPLVERIGKILGELARGLSHGEWGIALPSLVAAIDANPVVAERYKRVTDERRQVVSDLLNAAIKQSELPKGFPVDDFIDALVGPLFYRRLIRQLPTSKPWVLRHLVRTMEAYRLAET